MVLNLKSCVLHHNLLGEINVTESFTGNKNQQSLCKTAFRFGLFQWLTGLDEDLVIMSIFKQNSSKVMHTETSFTADGELRPSGGGWTNKIYLCKWKNNPNFRHNQINNNENIRKQITSV